MKRYVFILLILIPVFFSCKERVTLETLLEEMVAKERLTYFPSGEYHLRQFSSYDRKSTGPDKEHWWANADYTQFIREEEHSGRREFVMFETEGPGAIVRFWMTFAGEGAHESILRFYIDGADQPVIQGNAPEIISGGVLAPEPLSASVSEETDYRQRGHNLYLPIPYAKGCKVTIECDSIRIEEDRRIPSIYYNIGYRAYTKDVKVESFSQEVLEKVKNTVEDVCACLLDPEKPEICKTVDKSARLEPSEKVTLSLVEKQSAICGIQLKLQTPDATNQVLRSVVLAASFDGDNTVWVPAGDFFGTGYRILPFNTFYTQVSPGGELSSSWIMPFRDSAKIEFINYGVQPVEVEVNVSTKKYEWKKSSMYFGASWHEYYQVHTAKDPSAGNHTWHYDVNYVELEGKGVYAGDALTVFNTVDAWWGEGDEKIYVDGEYFPSSIGTGTEDYYGYAWCRPEKFSHPFIAQPSGAGNLSPGMTVNMRYRALDAIPFYSYLKADIEMWHWVKTKINYAMTSYWYAFPGTRLNRAPDEEAVKNPVARKRSDIYKPLVEKGALEGECLEIMSVSDGNVSVQGLSDVGWSRDSQLWWRSGKKGAELITRFILAEDGKYKMSAELTKAVDYGIIKAVLDGTTIMQYFNGYTPEGVTTEEVDLGTYNLLEGSHILKLVILGKDDRAEEGYMAGIDMLRFEKL